jgi:hypothetical protein
MKPLYIKQWTKIYIPDWLNTKQEKVSALQIARCYWLERYPFLILWVEKMQGRDTFNTIILEIQENYPEIIFY